MKTALGSLILLDVIMVWHAYQLSPRTFLEDCLHNGIVDFWKAGLPWEAIDACLNSATLDFTGSEEAKGYFEQNTGCKWDLLDDPASATVQSPRCNCCLESPWTSLDRETLWNTKNTFHSTTTGTGFADQGFRLACNCGLWITHDALRTHRFREDLLALRDKGRPMNGTILDANGTSTILLIASALQHI